MLIEAIETGQRALIPYRWEQIGSKRLTSSQMQKRSACAWVTSLRGPCGRWGEVFGGDVVAAAMIDRLVHHAEVISLKGDSCRLKERDLGRTPAATNE